MEHGRARLEWHGGLLTWLAQKAASLLVTWPRAPDALPCRFQDFAKIVWLLDPTGAEDALRALRTAQALAVTEIHPLLAAFMQYVPAAGIEGTTRDILERLRASGADLPYLGGGKKAARAMWELIPLLREGGIGCLEDALREWAHWVFWRSEHPAERGGRIWQPMLTMWHRGRFRLLVSVQQRVQQPAWKSTDMRGRRR